MKNTIKTNDLIVVDHNYSETVRGMLSENNITYGEFVTTSMELGYPNYRDDILEDRNTHFFVTSLRDIMVIFGSRVTSLGNGSIHIWMLGDVDPLSLYKEQLEEMRFKPYNGGTDIIFTGYPGVSVKTFSCEVLPLIEICTLEYIASVRRGSSTKRLYKFIEPVVGVTLHCNGRKSKVTVKQFFLEKYLQDCVEIELLSSQDVKPVEEPTLYEERKFNGAQVREKLREFRKKLVASGLYRTINPPLVVAGSAMVLQGLRDHTADIDLQIHNKDREAFVEGFNLQGLVDDLGGGLHRVLFEDFDIVFTDEVSSRTEVNWGRVLDGNFLPIQSLFEILDLKLFLNRDKDQDDIIYLKEVVRKWYSPQTPTLKGE